MGKYFSYWRPVEKMSLRDVRKENMTGFWKILRVKIRSIL